jgi:MarR family transcriptional regulator, transcriptional regulator for hemolysin
MQMTIQREQSAGYLTNWAGRLFVRAIEKRIPNGRAGQMPVFFALVGKRRLSQRDLAIAAAVEQPTMAATLTRMERDGMIVREPDPQDGRSALVRLTELGETSAEASLAAAREVNTLALSRLSPEEREQFMAALRNVIAALGAESR